MFDQVGHTRDPELPDRRALSGLVSVGFLGIVVGTAGMLLTQVVASTDLTPSQLPITVVMMEEPAEAELKPPSLPAAGGGSSARGTADVPPEPEEPTDDPAPLKPDPPKEIANTSGAKDGTANHQTGPGKGPGVGEGPGGPGTCRVPPCGEHPGGPVRMSIHELEVRKKPPLRYPDEARSLGVSTQACIADLTIDERGVPVQIDVQGCPPVFQRAARRGLSRWRWFPPRDGRSRVQAQTRMRVTFQLR